MLSSEKFLQQRSGTTAATKQRVSDGGDKSLGMAKSGVVVSSSVSGTTRSHKELHGYCEGVVQLSFT